MKTRCNHKNQFGRSQRPAPAAIEPLENRTMLTVLINPVFGVQSQKQDGSDGKMHRPPINVVFWGSFWQGGNGFDENQWDSAASPNAEDIMIAINKVINSTYLQGINQYGADPFNMFINDVRWDSSEPGSSVDTGNIDDVVQNQIDNGHVPEPDEQTDGNGNQVVPIYLVVTPPGVSSPGASGFNETSTDIDLGDFDTIPEMWTSVSANPNGTLNTDAFTRVFGHETAEIMTDTGGDGFEVNTTSAWALGGIGGDDQIGDKEGNAYSFRLSDSAGQPSIDVQPYWSKDDSKWLVTDGTAQTINLSAVWDLSDPQKPVFSGKYDLTINGDQWLDINDKLTITTSTSGAVTIDLNNEFYNFDAGYLNSISLNLMAGQNSVSIPTALPMTLNFNMNAASPFGGTIDFKGATSQQGNWDITGPGSGTFLFNSAGGSGSDTFSNVRSITAGSGSDFFTIRPGGSLAGNLDAGGGPDRLLYSSSAGPVTIDLVNQKATAIGGLVSGFEGVTGGNASDTLIASAPTWTLTGSDTGFAGNFNFASIENLVGGPGGDLFKFGLASSVSGMIDGGGGVNTLDYSQLPGPVTVNFTTHTASRIGGAFANIQNVKGSLSTADTIVGPDASWLISGADAGSVNGLTYSSFENLQGTAFTDTFTFLAGGLVSGNVNGGGGLDTLDYSQITTAVSINLTTHSATGIGGTFSNITSFVAGSGGSTVTGPAGSNTWLITGINTVSVAGITLTNTPAITGGPGDDQFNFQSGGRLDGRIDGGAGINTLSYTGNTGNVSVNLSLHTATRAGSVFNIANVIGGSGNSLLVGDENANVLTGGAGRNLLIGRAGADRLIGSTSDNLLISDLTIYDLNPVALSAIFNEWTRTDISSQKRISDLISEDDKKGLNGRYRLDDCSLIADKSSDILTGSSGFDWFILTKRRDTISSGLTPADRVSRSDD